MKTTYDVIQTSRNFVNKRCWIETFPSAIDANTYAFMLNQSADRSERFVVEETRRNWQFEGWRTQLDRSGRDAEAGQLVQRDGLTEQEAHAQLLAAARELEAQSAIWWPTQQYVRTNRTLAQTQTHYAIRAY